MARAALQNPPGDEVDVSQLRENIAYAVKMMMVHRGNLTQAQLAASLGFSGSQFTERMKGRTAWRDVDLARLGRRLGIPTHAFLLPPDEFRDALQALGYQTELAGERQLSLAISNGRRHDDPQPPLPLAAWPVPEPV